MEVQMIQLEISDWDGHGQPIIKDSFIVLHTIVAILPTTDGGSDILLQGGHTLKSPIPPSILVEHIYTSLEHLYGGEHRAIMTESKEEE